MIVKFAKEFRQSADDFLRQFGEGFGSGGVQPKEPPTIPHPRLPRDVVELAMA